MSYQMNGDYLSTRIDVAGPGGAGESFRVMWSFKQNSSASHQGVGVDVELLGAEPVGFGTPAFVTKEHAPDSACDCPDTIGFFPKYFIQESPVRVWSDALGKVENQVEEGGVRSSSGATESFLLDNSPCGYIVSLLSRVHLSQPLSEASRALGSPPIGRTS